MFQAMLLHTLCGREGGKEKEDGGKDGRGREKEEKGGEKDREKVRG